MGGGLQIELVGYATIFGFYYTAGIADQLYCDTHHSSDSKESLRTLCVSGIHGLSLLKITSEYLCNDEMLYIMASVAK